MTQLDVQAINILKATREIVSDPANWTQGALSRDSNGARTNILDPRTTCYCTLGALTKAMTDRVMAVKKLVPEDCYPELADQYDVHFNEITAFLDKLAGDDIVNFNDDPDTTHADVINLLDLAVDTVEERTYE